MRCLRLVLRCDIRTHHHHGAPVGVVVSLPHSYGALPGALARAAQYPGKAAGLACAACRLSAGLVYQFHHRNRLVSRTAAHIRRVGD